MKSIIIPGKPIPQQRPRSFRAGGKTITYNPQSKQQEEMRMLLRAQTMKHAGPLIMTCVFFMPIASSLSQKKKAALDGIRHNARPDLDNLLKFILDVLNGIAFDDDKQVVELHAYKFYSSEPRTEIALVETNEKYNAIMWPRQKI